MTTSDRLCSADSCSGLAQALMHGMCNYHYGEWIRARGLFGRKKVAKVPKRGPLKPFEVGDRVKVPGTGLDREGVVLSVDRKFVRVQFDQARYFGGTFKSYRRGDLTNLTR